MKWKWETLRSTPAGAEHSSAAEAVRENQELIAAFKKAYPEYLDVFAGLVVAAREAGGTRGYRTVDVKPESSK